MSSWVLVVFIHIAAAVLLLGTSILGEPAIRAAVRRAEHVQELRAALRIGRPMAVISPLAAIVVLGSGAYLTTAGGMWSMGWVQVAVAFWIVNTLMAVLVVKPAIQRTEVEARNESDSGVGARLDDLRWSAAWGAGVNLVAANDAAMLFLMTAKPGLQGSLAVVLLANAAVALGSLMFGGRRPPETRTSLAEPGSLTPGLQ